MNKNNEFNLFEVFSIVAKALSNAAEESKNDRTKRFNEGKGDESLNDLFRRIKEEHDLRPIGLKVNEEGMEEEEQEPLNTTDTEQPEEDEADSVIFGLNLSLPLPEELREYLKENKKARGLFEENTGQPFPFTCSGKCCGNDQDDEDEGEDNNDVHSDDGFDGRVISNETIRDVVDRLAGIEAKMLFGTLLGKELCLEASGDLSKLRKMFEEML